MGEEGIRSLFEIHEKNEAWFNAHYRELESEFEAKFIAVKDQKVLVAEDDIKKLLDILEEKGVDTNSVFITSIPSRGAASIL
ncbi:MAG: DUF5678 domain-containing protein [Asgard group archaeon]